MVWPLTTISTAEMDQGTDRPNIARLQIKEAVDALNYQQAQILVCGVSNPRDNGATGDGTTNDRTALATSDAAGVTIQLKRGTYRINTSITIASYINFEQGAILKPASGVVITLTRPISAFPSQIFDCSLGGSIVLSNPISLEVWAEWWGAKGDNTKTDNQIPINQALIAIASPAGTVRLGLGTFLTSGIINIKNYTRLVGSHDIYTQIKANAATWSGSIMIDATTGATPLFSSSVESMRISASNIGAISYCINSDAWQEGCWLKKLLIRDFYGYGINYTVGYGGAATFLMEDLQVWPADGSSGARSINMSYVASEGWFNVNLHRVTVGSGNVSPSGMSGVWLDGRIMLGINAFHAEYINNGIVLTNGACVVGNGMNGGPSTGTMFNCAGSWTGNINITGCRLGNAANMIVDTNRVYAMFGAVDLPSGHLVYPPDPGRAVASGNVLGGASPSFYYQSGFSSTITRSSAGVYVFTLLPSMDTSTSYDVTVTSLDTLVPIASALINTGTGFSVTTRNAAGAVADCAQFSIKVYHKA